MSIAKQIYQKVSSMKTGLILLLFIGADTALGSIAFPGGFFKTKVFQLLLILLLINMILCTFNRLNRLKSLLNNGKNKRMVRQMGIFLLHAGIVLILIGGTVNSFYGQKLEISIQRGETADLASQMHLDQPVSIRLDAFKIAVNKDGSPSQYYSYVTVRGENQKGIKRVISVNHPLVFQQIKAYQERFEYLVNVQPITISGDQPVRLMHEGDKLSIPGTQRTVKIFRYFPDFDPAGGMDQVSMKPDNPRIVYSVYEKNKLLGIGAARFGSKIEIDKQVFLRFNGVEPVTILKIKSDPGLGLALTGALLLMLGVCMAIFMVPAQSAAGKYNLEEHAGEDFQSLGGDY